MISQVVEASGEHFALVRLGAPYWNQGGRRAQGPTSVVVDQGNYLAAPGSRCVAEFVNVEQGPKTVALGPSGSELGIRVAGVVRPWWTGGALGRTGLSAHFVVPGQPDLHRGKVVIYRVLASTAVADARRGCSGAVVVKILDLLRSRHSCGGRAAPEPAVWRAVQEFTAYLGLDAWGGYDRGCASSPGDWAEREMRELSGDRELAHVGAVDDFAPYHEAKVKLRELGFDAGSSDTWDARAYAALVAFQDTARIVPDGVLGPISQQALRHSAPPG